MKPWMSDDEINMITKYLNSNSIMLEYGSGGSTVFYSRYVKEYYSIEHDANWYKKILAIAPPNVIMKHVSKNNNTPEKNRVVASSWHELDVSSRSVDYRDYIQYPSKLNKKFDYVLIDGRARPECAKFIIPYLKKDATIFIHDYCVRRPYFVVESRYRMIESIKKGQTLAVFKLK